MLKTFYFQFDDPFFSKEIQVNVNECQTINDLKKKIASYFHIFDYRKLTISNLPKETQLDKITEKFIFNLKFLKRGNNITFSLPNHNQVCVKNGYKMTRAEIIDSFRTNQIYYSNECIDNYFHFKIYKEELPQIEFPFLAIPSDVWVYVEMGCNIVNLKYGNKKYFFAENEPSIEAYKLIKETYQNCDSVLIQSGDSVLNYTEKLQRFTPYEVIVIYKLTFKNIESRNEFVLNLDFLSKISDARKELFERFCKNDVDNQDEIILYNGNLKRIDDYSKLLKDTQNFEIYFYFEYNKKSSRTENTSPYKNKIRRTKEIDSKFIYYPKTPTKEPTNHPPSPEKQQKYIFDYKSPKNRSKFSIRNSTDKKSSSLSITNTKLSSSQINSELNSTNAMFSNSPIRESRNYYQQNQSFSPENEQKYVFDYKGPINDNQTSPISLNKSESKTSNQKKSDFISKVNKQPSTEIPKTTSNQNKQQNRVNQNRQQKIDLNLDNNEYDNYYDDDFQINLSSDDQPKEKENKKDQHFTKSTSKSKEKLQIFEEEEEEFDFENKSDNLETEKNENQTAETELNSKENFDGDKQEINDLNEAEDLPNSAISSANEEEDLSNSLRMESDIYKFLEEED